jgi:serine/threonine protein kinase
MREELTFRNPDPNSAPITVYCFQELGQGAFGTVKLARCKQTSQLYAVKRISLHKVPVEVRPRLAKQCQLEIELMRRIDSPFVVKLYASLEKDGDFLLLLEYCNSQTLTQFVESYGANRRLAES